MSTLGFILLLSMIIVLMMRLSKYTQRLESLENRLFKIESTSLEKIQPDPVKLPPPPPSLTKLRHSVSQLTSLDSPSITPDPEPSLGTIDEQPLFKRFQIPSFIKDNWLGVVGAIACVIGSVFFGLTSGFLYRPEIRVLSMLIFSLLLMGISVKWNKLIQWQLICSLLKSTAAAIILFATLGAGGINGLQCIQSPLLALGALCIGISINVYLAIKSSSQFSASLHVILSLLAFCVAPQVLLFLPLGAAITIVGLLKASRFRWDIHLILIVLTFSAQNLIWSQSMEQTTSMHSLAMACSIAVGIVASAIHYNKKYKSSNIEGLPLAAHIVNWSLLAWNLYIHAPSSQWASLTLGAISIAGFFFSRSAKKKGIVWLYHTDTILSQILALGAVASFYTTSIRPLDLCILALLEVVTFNLIHNFLKENLMVRIGYFMQIGICFGFFILSMFKLFNTPSQPEQFPIYIRMGCATIICLSFYLYAKAKKFALDTVSYFFKNKENNVSSFSLTSLLGMSYFLAVYTSGSSSIFIQWTALILLLGVSFWRSAKEDSSLNVSFLVLILFFHLYHGLLLSVQKDLGYRIDFLGLVLIDILLIFKNEGLLKLWNKTIHPLIISLLAIQIWLITWSYSRPISAFVPALAYLGYSLFALQGSIYISQCMRYEASTKEKISRSLLLVGFSFIIGFLVSFVKIHMQCYALWHNIPVRQISEILGLGTLCYWIAYKPKNCKQLFIKFLEDGLIEVFLAFLSLVIFIEISGEWRATLWSILALGLLTGTKHFKWPSRLYTYSWIYLMVSIFQVGFISSTFTTSNPTVIQSYQIHLIIPVFLQFVFAYLSHRKEFKNRKEVEVHSQEKGIVQVLKRCSSLISQQPCIWVLLPIFLGISLLCAFNYEKTLLTLLWVVISCIYLSLGLVVKSKLGIQIAMGALAICSTRLLIFDLMQSDISIRALVFLGVGIFMLCISIFYKKYKYRVDPS